MPAATPEAAPAKGVSIAIAALPITVAATTPCKVTTADAALAVAVAAAAPPKATAKGGNMIRLAGAGANKPQGLADKSAISRAVRTRLNAAAISNWPLYWYKAELGLPPTPHKLPAGRKTPDGAKYSEACHRFAVNIKNRLVGGGTAVISHGNDM